MAASAVFANNLSVREYRIVSDNNVSSAETAPARVNVKNVCRFRALVTARASPDAPVFGRLRATAAAATRRVRRFFARAFNYQSCFTRNERL